MMMTKTFPILILFFVTSMTYGQQAHCDKLLTNFDQSEIEQECLDYLKLNAVGNLSRLDSYYQVEVYAGKNALLVKNLDKEDILGGDTTKLRNILSVRPNITDLEILVLLENGDIHAYLSNILGSVGPKRVLKNHELYGAVDIDIHNGSICVLNNLTKRLLFFKEQANSLAQKSHRHDDLVTVKELPSVHNYQSLSVDPKSGDIYILTKNGEVFIWEKSSAGIKLHKEGLTGDSLFYDATNGVLKIRTPSGLQDLN
jgi:hypothetical protein